MLKILKDQLLPGGDDPSTVLDRYSSQVTDSFRNPGRLNLLNTDQLMQDPAFENWEQSKKSCILLIHGRTAITSRDYSWLSPIGFRLVDIYHVQDRPVICHCCHDELFMKQDAPAHTVVSSLVYQLLCAKSAILRDQSRFDSLQQKFAEPSWRAGSPKAAFAALGELLEIFPEVHILLDRIDLIKGDPDRFVDPIVNLVKVSKSTIKFLLVASTNNQDSPEGMMTTDLLANIEDHLGPKRFSRLMQNQK